MNALFLRARKTVCTALVLGLSSPALADLPTVEGPKSKTDGTFYGKIAGYINDGLVLGGLVVAAVAFIVVAMSCVSTFAEVRDGKATWGQVWCHGGRGCGTDCRRDLACQRSRHHRGRIRGHDGDDSVHA